MLFRKDTHKINFPMLAKVIGWLLMIESAFMCIPTLTAYLYHESDWKPFMATTALTFVVGFCLNKYIHPHRASMAKREGFLLTTMVWVVFSLFGLLPFVFSNVPLNVGDAFFEAMAGFTTTGCSAYPDPEILSHGSNLWRAMMHWIGGMGIILFTLAILPMLNSSGGMQMFNAEVTGITHEKIQPRISQTAKGLWLIYILLTIACALLLWAGPMDLFDSICHALGTISTGGFTTRQLGPAAWNSPYVDIVISVFMFLGGTNFNLVFLLALGRFAAVKSNATFRAYVAIVAGMTAVFIIDVLVRIPHPTWHEYVVYPLFQVVGTMTSTGYAVPELSAWGNFALALIVPMMLFGACAGSTSGGAKIDRLIVLCKYLRNALKRALQPNNITSIEIDGKVLPADAITKTISFLCFYFVVICLSGLLLSVMGFTAADGFFSSASCMSNIGICPQQIGGTATFTDLPTIGKLLLSLVMLIGRLEVFTVLLLFMPNFWHR